MRQGARPNVILILADDMGFADLGLAGSEIAIIPGAAHAMSIDRPAEWVAVLRAFLSRNDAPAPSK